MIRFKTLLRTHLLWLTAIFCIQLLLVRLVAAQSPYSNTKFAESNTSDVDFSPSVGTHSNFSAQQSGPDNVYDIITEGLVGTNYELDLEIQWTNVTYEATNAELAILAEEGTNTHSLNASGGYMIVGNGSPNWASPSGTISFWVYLDTVGNRPWGQHTDMELRFYGGNLILDWGAGTDLISNTSFIAGKWYFIAVVWNENTNELWLYVGDQDSPPTLDAYSNSWYSFVSSLIVTENNFMASRGGLNPTLGRGDDLRYWGIDRNLTELQKDYRTELNGSEANLISYFKLNGNFEDVGPSSNNSTSVGTCTFSLNTPFDQASTEELKIDIWTGSSWQALFTGLETGWNNISISSYLNSSIITIRLKGAIETTDDFQDVWKIDTTLLYIWAHEPTFNWTNYIFFAFLALGILIPVTLVLKQRNKIKTPSSASQTFVEKFGMNNQDLVGKKILLEVDPTSGFYRTLIDFASKSISDNTSLHIFTRKNSLLHTKFSDEKVQLFLMSPKISSLKHLDKKEVLVPMRDLSVLLYVITKTTKKGIKKPRIMIFDNLSDTILMCGFEKTYKFLRFLLESMSPKVSALFVFNPTAHGAAVSSSIRGLFQHRLAPTST
ncbi:MAG: hypothetical protein JSV05_10125 [Candidatus Bathyarchaeota archaeon]|nr:MAG: hypothetical protein JSV05_10125 [Candidatus Bathyarchaeota archaeon]